MAIWTQLPLTAPDNLVVKGEVVFLAITGTAFAYS